MFLGAIAPDAHTECAGFDRTALHPGEGANAVPYVLGKLWPRDAFETPEGRAFVVGCVSHLVADELTRGERPSVALSPGENLIHLDEREATKPTEAVDLQALRHALAAPSPLFVLRPLTPAALDAKRHVVLGQPALAADCGCFLDAGADWKGIRGTVRETLAQLNATPEGRALIAPWPLKTG